MAEATVGEYLASVRMIGVDDGVGLENVVNSFQVTPTEGLLELKAGIPGPQGPAGPDAWPWEWRGDVTDMAALDAIRPTLGTGNRGWAYRVMSTNSVMYWDGETFYPFLEAFGAMGPRGFPNELTIGTVTTLAEGEDAYADITGDPPNQVLHLGIPRGGQGEVGPPGQPGPVMNSADVDNSIPLAHNYVLAYKASTGKLTPTPWPGTAGPWGLGEANFSTGSNVSAASTTIATLTIPGQPTAWRPRVEGGLSMQSHVSSIGAGRADCEVRIGSSTGQIVAIAPGFPTANWFRAQFYPYFGATMSPTSTTGVIPANTTVTLFFVINRNLGSSNYSWTNSAASAIVYAEPVVIP
ncbi:hypothetical protein QLG13_08045 [Rhodococcus aetherivorans]|uniref:hypothetical protein n=1 Tax=Rhodococcus aetherivorans TaxID=191292 RepID=UPI003EC04178